jgi:CHRD domain
MRTRIAVSVAAVSAAAAVLGVVALASGQPSSQAGSAAQAQLDKRVLFAVLTGKKEVDAEGNRGVGDPDGRGTFTATIDGTELCFGLTVKNIDDPAAAHIHRGRASVAGPVVVPLVHPDSGDPGASSGCVDVTSELAEAILKNPHRYYANVHNAAFGGGAVRGQLFRRPR